MAEQRRNGAVISSVVAGTIATLLTFFVLANLDSPAIGILLLYASLFGLVGVIVGIIGLRRARATGGRGMAAAGLILSVVPLVALVTESLG